MPDEATKKTYLPTIDDAFRAQIDNSILKPALIEAFRGKAVTSYDNALATFNAHHSTNISPSSFKDAMKRCGLSIARTPSLTGI